jgi:hypothetical protein
MRPGAEAPVLGGQPRKSSLGDIPVSTQGSQHNSPMMTYFLANQSQIDESMSKSTGSESYGVESLEDTISRASMSEEADDKPRNLRYGDDDTNDKVKRPEKIRSFTQASLDTVKASTSSKSPHLIRPETPVSQLISPLNVDSPGPGSTIPGSPVTASIRSFSLRNSDDDSDVEDSSSQAIVSSGDEEGDTGLESVRSIGLDSKHLQASLLDSDPQLIMPSIRMPSRRPFTTRGKEMGRLKVLIAGDSGILSPHYPF